MFLIYLKVFSFLGLISQYNLLAKGRTNVDLQRNFYDDVRPKDAYDTMETFTKSARSTPSRDSPIRGFQESLLQSRFQVTPGPITKVTADLHIQNYILDYKLCTIHVAKAFAIRINIVFEI